MIKEKAVDQQWEQRNKNTLKELRFYIVVRAIEVDTQTVYAYTYRSQTMEQAHYLCSSFKLPANANANIIKVTPSSI